MQNQAGNIIQFDNFKQSFRGKSSPQEVVYMPFVVYYPVYVPVQQQAQAEPLQTLLKPEDNRDNVVSIYDYLGEI